ncbi:MAG: carbohydrate ABC transporter permease, partial [Ruthenibacterium sp.]
MKTHAKRIKSNKLGMFVLIILAVISLAPILLVLINSLKTHEQILKNPLSLPTSFLISNFTKTWELANFGVAFLNSIKLTATAVIVACLVASCIGYVLAGKKISAWKFLSVYFMVATTIPLQLFMLPLYSLFVKLNLLGNVYAVGVAIAAWNIPLPIFLMRTYYLKVPFE